MAKTNKKKEVEKVNEQPLTANEVIEELEVTESNDTVIEENNVITEPTEKTENSFVEDEDAPIPDENVEKDDENLDPIELINTFQEKTKELEKVADNVSEETLELLNKEYEEATKIEQKLKKSLENDNLLKDAVHSNNFTQFWNGVSTGWEY